MKTNTTDNLKALATNINIMVDDIRAARPLSAEQTAFVALDQATDALREASLLAGRGAKGRLLSLAATATEQAQLWVLRALVE